MTTPASPCGHEGAENAAYERRPLPLTRDAILLCFARVGSRREAGRLPKARGPGRGSSFYTLFHFPLRQLWAGKTLSRPFEQRIHGIFVLMHRVRVKPGDELADRLFAAGRRIGRADEARALWPTGGFQVVMLGSHLVAWYKSKELVLALLGQVSLCMAEDSEV